MWDTIDAKSFAEACFLELKKPVTTPGGRAGDDAGTGSSGNGTNWVERTRRGKLPRYIRIVRNGLMREGHSEGRATALAVAAMKRWARGGDNVRPAVQRAAAAALAEWEAMKAGKSDDIEPEEKVRVVRTPAGAAHFGQPIGSVITGDMSGVTPDIGDVTDYGHYAEVEVKDPVIEALVNDAKVKFRIGQDGQTDHHLSVVGRARDWSGDPDPNTNYLRDAGWLTIKQDDGKVDSLYVAEPFQRNGLATRMWELYKILADWGDLVQPKHSDTVLPDGQQWINSLPEEKVVRHVRTPAGVRRYNQPIGSIIVADRKLRNLTGLDSIYDGWDRAKGSDGKEYSPSAGSAANSDSGGSGTAPAGKPRKPSGEAKPKPEEARTRRTRVVGIEKGDTLTELAKRYNTTVRHLMRLNPKIKNPDVIYAGDDIRVPRKNRRQRRRLPNSLGHVVATMPKKKPAESAKE